MTTNQTIDGVLIPRQLAARLASLELGPLGYFTQGSPVDELRALLDAYVEPIPDDYVPLDGMFRVGETEEGMTYWLKAGGYKSRLYDFMASHPNLDFYGLKWEWNGDLKVAFRWNCAPELRISERVPIEENQETILGGVLPLVMVVRESNMPPGRIQAAANPEHAAVVLPTQQDFEWFIIRRDGSVNVSVLGKSRFYNDATIDREYFVWLTCLDEVTQLNAKSR